MRIKNWMKTTTRSDIYWTNKTNNILIALIEFSEKTKKLYGFKYKVEVYKIVKPMKNKRNVLPLSSETKFFNNKIKGINYAQKMIKKYS